MDELSEDAMSMLMDENPGEGGEPTGEAEQVLMDIRDMIDDYFGGSKE